MLFEYLRGHVGENAAPFVGVALFVVVVGVSLWLTPRLAYWIDKQKKETPGSCEKTMERSIDLEEEKKEG